MQKSTVYARHSTVKQVTKSKPKKNWKNQLFFFLWGIVVASTKKKYRGFCRVKMCLFLRQCTKFRLKLRIALIRWKNWWCGGKMWWKTQHEPWNLPSPFKIRRKPICILIWPSTTTTTTGERERKKRASHTRCKEIACFLIESRQVLFHIS